MDSLCITNPRYNQGGHPFLTPKFQDISWTFSGHFCIFAVVVSKARGGGGGGNAIYVPYGDVPPRTPTGYSVSSFNYIRP